MTHELQHTKLPCPSPALRACANSCPLSRWSHPTISSSVIPFSFCPQSFPQSGPFPMIRLITSGGQSIGASASVLLMNIQGWFPFRLTGLFSLHPRDSWESSLTLQFQSINSLALNLLCGPTHIHTWLLGKQNKTKQNKKTQLWLNGPLLAKWCLCFLIHQVCHGFPSKVQES